MFQLRDWLKHVRDYYAIKLRSYTQVHLLALLINFINSLHFTDSQVSSSLQKHPTTAAKWLLPYDNMVQKQKGHFDKLVQQHHITLNFNGVPYSQQYLISL